MFEQCCFIVEICLAYHLIVLKKLYIFKFKILEVTSSGINETGNSHVIL